MTDTVEPAPEVTKADDPLPAHLFPVEKEPRRTRLERVLLEKGVVKPEDLRAARDRQKGAKRPLLEVLLEQEAVDEAEAVRVLAESTGMERVSPEDLKADPDVQDLVPPEIAQRLGILPLRIEDDTLVVATGVPWMVPAFDEVSIRTGYRVRPLFAAPSAVREALRVAREGEEGLEDILKHHVDEDEPVLVPVPSESGEEEGAESEGGGPEVLELDAPEDDSPIIRLLNLILSDAVRQGASDIHIEPEKDALRVRFRVDGKLRKALDVPRNVSKRLLARLKIVSALSTIETRRPQDGRAKITLRNLSYDLRISTLPSYFGEKAVIRILDSNAPQFNLDKSGIEPEVLDSWRRLLHTPQGLLLVTGPTGSGKSTTLYASLLELRETTKNIVTVEDPVEYQFQGIVHVPVRSDIGMTFAAALRSILRQDPDIVLLGEIRDKETAEIALRAAMTGHLVLSTLHTNDAVGALSRLFDLGISPQLLASSLLGVLAQRLIRTNCPECAKPHAFSEVQLERLDTALPPETLAVTKKGEGCNSCRGTGYRGRTAIVELVQVTRPMKRLIGEAAEQTVLWNQARADGMSSLFESGLRKLGQGVSTPEAVLDAATPDIMSRDSEPESRTVPVPAPGPSEETRTCEECGEIMQANWKFCPACGTKPVILERPVAVVCDDAAMVRALVKGALRPLFPTIVEAADGKQGLDAVSRVKPDLLVIDQLMPEMTGVEVIRELRRQLETATLPIIMLTALESADLESEVFDAGADDYLRKPIAVEKLRGRVKRMLASLGRAAARASPEAT